MSVFDVTQQFFQQICELQNETLNSSFLFSCPSVFRVRRKCYTEQMRLKNQKFQVPSFLL